ncbi:MAG: carboxylate-amine ligase, partial [Cyanobacteriota bacterium]
MAAPVPPPLSFHALQRQLRPEWGREHGGHGGDVDLLLVPSLSVDPAELALITGAHHYEERQLFSLIRLRDPGVRIVVVTSKLLPDLVVDTVLELMPGVPAAHARRRLHL